MFSANNTRYTINGAISGFGPLIVSTFGYNTLESILFQFPVGAVCVIFIPLCGFIPTVIPNTRIPMLITCCLPVIAGCVMIWKSQWGHKPVVPVVGYALTGFFGPVVSLVITLGASNVAGATKKTVMAATVFVAYTVGNIIGPQLVKSNTKAQHYPELWTGMVIWSVFPSISTELLTDMNSAILSLSQLQSPYTLFCGGRIKLGRLLSLTRFNATRSPSTISLTSRIRSSGIVYNRVRGNLPPEQRPSLRFKPHSTWDSRR